MQAPVPTLAVVTYPPGALNTQARIVIDGVRGAIFVYQNGGPLGALVGSWASTAGTDPYGNVYPQGLNVSLGSISGTTINFPNGYINSNGFFLYSGTPATGNLVTTLTFASGTDSHGNKYLSGATVYLIVAGTTYAVNLSLPSGQGFPGFSVVDVNNLPFAAPGVFAESSSAVGTPQAFAVVASGQATAADVAAYFSVLSQVQSSVTGGQMVAQCGLFQLNSAGNLADLFVSSVGYPRYNLHTLNTPGTFNWGHFEASASANQQITSASAVSISGSNVAVDATSYRIIWEIFYHGNQAAGTPSVAINLTGGATVGFAIGEFKFWASGGLTTRLNPTTGTFQNNQLGPTLVTAVSHMTIEAWVSFSASGVIQINGAEGTAGDSWGVDACLTRLEKRQ